MAFLRFYGFPPLLPFPHSHDISVEQSNPYGICRATEQLGKHIGAFEADNSQRDASFRDIIQQLGRKAIESRTVDVLGDSDNKPKEAE